MKRAPPSRPSVYICKWVVMVSAIISMSFAANEALAVESQKRVTIPLGADTKDLHISVSGNITKVEGITDFSENNTDGGKYSAAWTSPPGAGNRVITVTRNSDAAWNFKYWLTTDGKIKPFPLTPGTPIASLYTPSKMGQVLVMGDNPGLDPVFVTDVEVTVVSGLASFFSPDWASATGITFDYNSDQIPAGATDFQFMCSASCAGSPVAGPNEWVLISASFDGAQSSAGYINVPEPSTWVMLLCGFGILGLTGMRATRKNETSPVS